MTTEGEGSAILELVNEIACSRLDCIPVQKRNDLIKEAASILAESESDRAAFSKSGCIGCSTKNGYNRIAQLYQVSIANESQNDIRISLCKKLCELLKKASDPALLEDVKSKLPLEELSDIFSEIAKENAIPAVAFTTPTWDTFISSSMSDPVATSPDMALCRSALKTMDAETWEKTIAPALLLKIKAKPETVLDFAQGLFENVSSDVLAQSSLIVKEGVPTLVKHARSPKEIVRFPAAKILQRLATAAVESNDGSQASALLSEVSKSVSDPKSLAQAYQRQTAYEILKVAGTIVGLRKVAVKSETASTVMTSICTVLKKEAKSAEDIRTLGVEALLRWMVIGKRNGQPKGYETALAFISTPAVSKQAADAPIVLGGMVTTLDQDILESIVVDLFNDAKFVKGLETFIEAANKKHASASSIPQVAGLLAVYLSLVNAVASNSKSLPPPVEKAVAAASSVVEKTSFVFGAATTKAIAGDAVVGCIVPRIITLYLKFRFTTQGNVGKIKPNSGFVHALACSILNPSTAGGQNPTTSTISTVETVLGYQNVAQFLVEAVFAEANRVSLESAELKGSLYSSRQASDMDKEDAVKGKCSSTGSILGMDVNAVRHIARLFVTKILEPKQLAMAMVLMHIGSSLRVAGKQRTCLLKYVTNVLMELPPDFATKNDAFAVMGGLISELASRVNSDDGGIGEVVQSATRSLIVSLGAIASNYSHGVDDPEDEEMKPYVLASKLCINEIAPRLSEEVRNLESEIEAWTALDIKLHKSKAGTLVAEKEAPAAVTKINKGRMTEEEQWEMQMKQEMEAKKSVAKNSAPVSADDKKKIKEQDERRKSIAATVASFNRTFDAIQSLLVSDIEIGNACLPLISKHVLKLAVSNHPGSSSISGIKEKCFAALTALAGCVYEIQEEYAPMLAMALTTSYRQVPSASKSKENAMTIAPLPSPCEPAAVTIFEMDEFQEELSGASFAFLFPVVQAALMGPRTTPGCEGALRVLERHTLLLTGEYQDAHVLPLRADMAASVLELLKHDRSQAFVDPSPSDVLVACYQTGDEENAPTLSVGELGVLLDERGALGSTNCRMGAMAALGSIAANQLSVVKANPLVESRIWLNCFDENESVKSEARKTWGILKGSGTDELTPPSAMYSIPLLPLLNSENKSIAKAAAGAFAAGMSAHPGSVDKNLEKLFTTYIDSCPRPGSESMAAPETVKVAAPAPAKKKPMGVPASLKKKTVKKSALQVAGIGQPKRKKKTATHSAMLKPKAERKLDQAALSNQFKTGPVKVPAEKDSPEKVVTRLGVLGALASLPTANVAIEIGTLSFLSSFLMAFGIADGDEEVKGVSRNTLRDLIATYGASDEAIAFLLPSLDEILKTGNANTASLDKLSLDALPSGGPASDRRKEGAVVALGSVAIHLKGPDNASKIDTTIEMLLQSLKTPNEGVQTSVADALTKLMKKGNTQSRIETILDDLVNDCLEGDSSDTRRGAAYGMAAAVKGSGIASLKKYNIVSRLEEACSAGTATNKEGSLFAIEKLCIRLGLLFEPYVIVLLPSLLKSFSDNSDYVRKAASHTVGIIMSKLSAHGVKLVMPAVLTAFNDSAWRTKQASIHMLGSMCHLAPKQLASALPKVVPKLIEAFADTHPKVKGTAQEALDEISTVIRNPEISSISSTLLKALTDPSDGTLGALEALIETEFLHAIDAPSLALIVPILHRGLRDRTATTKRYGALITGNICTMINDPRDFIPYLPTLVPDLQAILLDPIPDVRSISAKAFGSLTRGLGEDTLTDLRPWLLEKLQAEDVSSAERSGAAQGLTEVLIASGTEVVESVVLDDILPLQSHPSPSTREGVLWMLTFLPPALGQNFTSLLDDCLPTLISGLSDESEQVREVGMRAGRVLIRSNGRVHFKKILPILSNGMTDLDYRIRLSSLMLLGDLLSLIGGTTVLRTDGDTQDDIRKAERAQAQLTLTLGIETRNKVLGDVYLARCDSAVAVRQTAVQVWKTVVSVTVRILKQILPVLVSRIVSDLASGDAEKTEAAGKCLGDIVGKLGDSVLPEIIPVLRNSLYEGDNFTRRGVCVGLSEVIGSSTKDQILRFLDIIVKAVQDALCDDDEGVREMAASSFQNLYILVGSRAMDEVVPSLIVALESDDADEERRIKALNGLTGILSIRSKEILPYIIPRLIESPITPNHARALASVASVTGDTIYYHFKSIIPALILDLANPSDGDADRENEVRESARAVCANSDESGVNWLIGEIVAKCSSDKAAIRRECCWMLGVVIEERADRKDFYDQIPIIIRELVARLNDDNAEVLKAVQKTFSALSKKVAAEELVNHVEFLRNQIASLVSDARRRKGGVGDGEFLLPGFNIPKGLEPLLPIFQRGILYGTPSVREASAAGLGEVISLTATKFLAGPLIIKMTGPLLRIVGDRNPSNVKIAILKTLGLILTKGGPALRAFVPQFQTTFVKALADPSRQVRMEAIGALGLLMPLSTRVDPLLKELVAGSLGKSSNSDAVGVVAVQAATLEALAVVLRKGGKKAKLPDSIPAALRASQELIEHTEETVREAAAKVFGVACENLGAETTAEVVGDSLFGDAESGDVRHGRACAIRRVLSEPVGAKLEGGTQDQLKSQVLEYMKDDKAIVRNASCVAIGAVVARSPDASAALGEVKPELLAIMGNSKEKLETHQAIAGGLCLALVLAEAGNNVDFFGLDLVNATLKLAMSGAQRVQFAFNDVLYLALNVAQGQEGLDYFSSIAMFENSKQMKSLYSKVLLKIKEVTVLDL